MVYDQFKDGLVRESTFGTSAIPNTNTQTYQWGIIGGEFKLPNVSTSIIYRATGVNAREVPAGQLWKSSFDLKGSMTLVPFNGIFLEACLGNSSTAGAGPYTHTIAPPTDGSQLPSFTFQHERTDSQAVSSDWATQYLGCKMNSLTLNAQFGNTEWPALLAVLDWQAKKTEKVAFTLTNDPIFPPTANQTPYWINGFTRTYDGDSISGLRGMALTIMNGLQPIRAHTWDTGTYTGRWPLKFSEAPRIEYQLKLVFNPDDSSFYEDMIAGTNTKDIVFKWTRSTNDYIQISLSDCVLTGYDMMEPQKPGEPVLDELTCDVRACSIEVKDSIAGSYYGE